PGARELFVADRQRGPRGRGGAAGGGAAGGSGGLLRRRSRSGARGRLDRPRQGAVGSPAALAPRGRRGVGSGGLSPAIQCPGAVRALDGHWTGTGRALDRHWTGTGRARGARATSDSAAALGGRGGGEA